MTYLSDNATVPVLVQKLDAIDVSHNWGFNRYVWLQSVVV